MCIVLYKRSGAQYWTASVTAALWVLCSWSMVSKGHHSPINQYPSPDSVSSISHRRSPSLSWPVLKVINGKNGVMMKNHTIKRPGGKREALAHSPSFLMSSHLCLFTGVMKPDLLTQIQKLGVIVIVRWEPESVTTTSCLRARGEGKWK